MFHQKGFSLLSFLLYLVLFSLMMLLSCHIVTSLIIPSFSSIRRSQSLISLHIATDLFVRDIRIMRNSEHQWKVIRPQEVIWNQGNSDIGWLFVDNRLERREGTYDEEWKNSTMSTIARNISKATFIYETRGGRVVGIELVMMPPWQKEKPVTCYVAVSKQENA